MKRFPKLLNITDLEKLNTSRLLKYLKHLNQCEESIDKSDLELCESESAEGIIQFKDSQIWNLAYTNVKSILDKREHIE